MTWFKNDASWISVIHVCCKYLFNHHLHNISRMMMRWVIICHSVVWRMCEKAFKSCRQRDLEIVNNIASKHILGSWLTITKQVDRELVNCGGMCDDRIREKQRDGWWSISNWMRCGDEKERFLIFNCFYNFNNIHLFGRFLCDRLVFIFTWKTILTFSKMIQTKTFLIEILAWKQ